MQIGDFGLFIFDWDGTLSTSTFLVKASRFFKSRYNIEYIKKNEDRYRNVEYRKGMSIKINEEVKDFASLLYNAYAKINKNRLKSRSEDVLRLLNKRGKKVAVFSDGKGMRLLTEVRKHRIVDYFDIIASADEIKEYKPSPVGLWLIAEELHVERKKSIYIGDMSVDIMTAKFAGMGSCAIADGFQSYWDLEKVKPDYIFRNLGEFLSVIKK